MACSMLRATEKKVNQTDKEMSGQNETSWRISRLSQRTRDVMPVTTRLTVNGAKTAVGFSFICYRNVQCLV